MKPQYLFLTFNLCPKSNIHSQPKWRFSSQEDERGSFLPAGRQRSAGWIQLAESFGQKLYSWTTQKPLKNNFGILVGGERDKLFWACDRPYNVSRGCWRVDGFGSGQHQTTFDWVFRLFLACHSLPIAVLFDWLTLLYTDTEGLIITEDVGSKWHTYGISTHPQIPTCCDAWGNEETGQTIKIGDILPGSFHFVQE